MNFEKLFGKQVIIKLLFYLLLLYANQNVVLLFLFHYLFTAKLGRIASESYDYLGLETKRNEYRLSTLQ